MATVSLPDTAAARLAESRRLDWLQAGVVALMLVLLFLGDVAGWLVAYPREWIVPVTPALNVFMNACVDLVGPAFRAISAALDVPMTAVRELLNWLPWSVTLTLLTFVRGPPRAGGSPPSRFSRSSTWWSSATGTSR